jgi:hypothetical protein
MEPGFVHHRRKGREFGDLVPERFGIITVEVLAAPAALRWSALDDLTKWLGWDPRADVMAMTGRPTPSLARGGSRRPSFDRGGIGGRGLGGVSGVAVEPLLQLSEATLQRFPPCPDGGLGLGRHKVPKRLGNRRRIAHAAWYTGCLRLKGHVPQHLEQGSATTSRTLSV